VCVCVCVCVWFVPFTTLEEEEEVEQRLLLGVMHCTLSRVRALSPLSVRVPFTALEEEEEEAEPTRWLCFLLLSLFSCSQ
jgi:hypothetical protein